MADITQTDVSRPSALPSARLHHGGGAGGMAAATSSQDQSSDAYLDAFEEEWNKKIDAEVETLVDGMVDIVNIAAIGDKDKFCIAKESFQAQCRAESMVRAAHSLLSLTHSMKLLLLLSDESQIVQQRDRALREARADTQETREKVDELLTELLAAAKTRTNSSSVQVEPSTDISLFGGSHVRTSELESFISGSEDRNATNGTLSNLL